MEFFRNWDCERPFHPTPQQLDKELLISLFFLEKCKLCLDQFKYLSPRVDKVSLSPNIRTIRYYLIIYRFQILKLYMDCSKTTNYNIIINSLLGWYAVILHLLMPFNAQPSYKMVGNETIEMKTLPLALWLPFDGYSQFVVSYRPTFYVSFSINLISFSLLTAPA